MPLRNNARRRRYRNAYVDFHCEYHPDPRSAGIRSGRIEQDTGTSAGQLRHDVCVASDHLDHRRIPYLYPVPDRQMEEKSRFDVNFPAGDMILLK